MTTAVQTKPKKKKREATGHLKIIPETRELRDRIRAECEIVGHTLDKSKPLTKAFLRETAENLLQSMDLGEKYLAFTMVCLSNEFWREQVQAIDFKRRLLLLPHCLKHAEGCPADYDEFGLDCRKCGACSVADFKVKAEDLGYKVLVSEGTPIVLKIIVSGHVDAIVGVACLNVLEKALDKVLLTGVPCVATPLLSSNCRDTSVDEDWVAELIDLHTPAPEIKTRSYVHLIRAANKICEDPQLSQLAPRRFQNLQAKDPLAVHENIVYDWMAQGGKRSRPFITLAAYDALNGGHGRESEEKLDLPDSVQRAALAIEAFHKASLVHDDIEDDDTFRYGRETLHRQHGVGTAINIGDYLIGMGYRLVARDRKEIGAEVAADILDRLSQAHLKLSEGQGAELLWRDAQDKTLTPLDALKIYALKTSPAFEAALYSGLRLAGSAEQYEKMVTEFSKNLGVAFQILNDLKDWNGDEDNKMIAGQDALAARPTLLLALALEGSGAGQRDEMLALLAGSCENSVLSTQYSVLSPPHANGNGRGGDHQPNGIPNAEHRTPNTTPDDTLTRIRQIFESARVFEKADKLVEKYIARAESIADEAQPIELRELLYYLVDTVLERHTTETPVESEPLQLGTAW